MDLVNALVGMKQAGAMAQVQFRVAAKVMEMERFAGSAAVKLIEAAGAGVGAAGDALVAAATGLGGELDVYG